MCASRFDFAKKAVPGLLTELFDKIVTGAAVTTINLCTGISLAEGPILFISRVHDPLGTPCNYSLFYNNDMVPANYWREQFYTDGAVRGSARYNNAIYLSLLTGEGGSTNGWLVRDVDGYPRFAVLTNTLDPASIRFYNNTTIRNNVADVTRMDVKSDRANGIGIGSRFWGTQWR